MRAMPITASQAAVWLAAIAAIGVTGCSDASGDSAAGDSAGGLTEATFVGSPVCAECHAQEHEAWTGSHHDLAMQVANETTVLGDFDNASLTYYGDTSTFTRRDDGYYVRTRGADGELHDYRVAYVFGVDPLQQYLIEFPGGRLQALTLSWDTRPAEQGGQRWFHLYPEEEVGWDDPLHWTGPYLNWNYMCAACHSTDLKRGYDAATNSYQTTWEEIDVGCEACHGPGSGHLAWAEEAAGPAAEADSAGAGGADRYASAADVGLLVDLADRSGGTWTFAPGDSIATRTAPRSSNTQIETCAPCHARRRVVDHGFAPGRPLLDTHRPDILEVGLYHSDGQILEEVYVYGSFVQSRMFMAGVTCSDCHDPHSLQRTRTEGNAVCARCHLHTVYDTPDHHFHEAGTAGASCVGCHMPPTTYMVIDPRSDHSMRIPRPDLTELLGTPNACNSCHDDRSAAWASAAVDEWYGPDRPSHYGEVLHAARAGAPGADAELAAIVRDPSEPGIVRATALALLQGYAGRVALEAIEAGASDPDPLVRVCAAYAMQPLAPSQRLRLGLHLFDDPLRSVRIEAARTFASIPLDSLTPEQAVTIEGGIQELEEAQRVNEDRAFAHTNLGLLYQERGRPGDAEAAYRRAIELEPAYTQAYANLADLYRLMGREAEGEDLVRQALEEVPDDGALHHVLGLLLVRQGRIDEAIGSLRRAAELTPQQARFSFVYAIGLNSNGETDRALAVLDEAHARHPYDPDLLLALITIHRDRGEMEAAVEYATKLVDVLPDDLGASRLLQELQVQAAPGGATP